MLHTPNASNVVIPNLEAEYVNIASLTMFMFHNISYTKLVN